MKFSHAHLSYGERTVLRDINLTIQPGEFVFLIGSSGSGKTSFIRSMIGALPPKKGQIQTQNGNDIYTLSSKELLAFRRSIGVIFQDFKLLPKKTVRENVAFALEVSGYETKKIHERVLEVLSKVGLITKKDKFIESLSGGELQRVAIARALIHDPNIIIGDEPTGNLDPANAEEVIALLERLHDEGKTIIISTHDDRLVDRLQKRVIAFRDGAIVSDISPAGYSL